MFLFCNTNKMELDPNNTNFPIQMREFVNRILIDKEDWLKPAQRIVHDVYYHLKRGILLFWKMGTGKTRGAIARILASPKNKVVVILNKSLLPDFTSKLGKIRLALEERGLDTSKIDSIRYVSMNAGNVVEQLERATSNLSDTVLKDCDVIIDEAHHFFNAVTNGSKNANVLFRKFMNAKDCNFVFLTGTPITKDIWEMVPCFNILAGYELLPENKDDFEEMFGNGQNRRKLENRLMGLISYYELPDDLAKIHLPIKLPEKIVKLVLTPTQLSKYWTARDSEIAEVKFTKKTSHNLKLMTGKSNTISSYRSKSRQYSNITPPDHCYVDGKFDPSLLTDDDCKNMDEYSPKLVAMWKNIEEVNKNGIVKQFCYSQYKGSGVLLFKRYAEYKGWSKFALLTGDIEIKTRGQNVALYNEDNHECDLLFITVTGSEGFDFKGSRACHIFEPFWHNNIISQVEARGNRMDSHSHLPKEQRYIQTFVYLTTLPKKVKIENEEDDLSTDEYIYQTSIERDKEINELLSIYKRVSINCTKDCKICTPTNQKLYRPNIAEDLEMPDPCVEPKNEKLHVSEILYGDEKYYYDDKKRIITFNESLNSYIYMDLNNPLYSILFNLIKD